MKLGIVSCEKTVENGEREYFVAGSLYPVAFYKTKITSVNEFGNNHHLLDREFPRLAGQKWFDEHFVILKGGEFLENEEELRQL